MVKKRETKVAELRDQTAASRRDFVKAGAAAGLGAAILSAPGKAEAQRAPADIRWDYEADVIVCGSGGTGIVAAKRAHDLAPMCWSSSRTSISAGNWRITADSRRSAAATTSRNATGSAFPTPTNG